MHSSQTGSARLSAGGIILPSCRSPPCSRGLYSLSLCLSPHSTICPSHLWMRTVTPYGNSLTLCVICCIFFYTCNPSATAFIWGLWTQCNTAFLLCWLFSCPFCLYLHILYPNSSVVYRAACGPTGGGRAGHFDITEGDTFTSNIILTSKDIHYPGTRCDL